MNITHRNRIIIAGLMGNLIEAFDMATCGLLSVFLAKYLTRDTYHSLFIILATFFLGFLARPIGALILGLCSDRYGRKKTLAVSIIIMGIATSLIGVIPSYQAIGFGAVLCLFSLRIIQSLSCGAEFLNSSSFLVESTGHAHKGYSASWAAFGATAGTLAASVLLLLITKILVLHPSLEWFLWRIPFAFALLGSFIGLYIRYFIPESREYVLHYASCDKPLFIDLIRSSFQLMLSNRTKSICVFLISSLGVSVTCLIYIYPSIQVHVYNQLSMTQILTSNIISLTVMLCFFPLMGKLSDRLNRTRLIRNSAIAILILLYPFFYILRSGTFLDLVIIQALIAIPAAAYYATVPVFLAELFPINLRCTLLSVIYSVAASLFGGIVPLISLLLIEYTQNPVSPLLIILSLVATTSLMLSRNSKQQLNDTNAKMAV